MHAVHLVFNGIHFSHDYDLYRTSEARECVDTTV